MSKVCLFTVTFHSRDFQPISQPFFTFKPLTCSWRALGGPDRASIAVSGDPRTFSALGALLGTPVILYAPDGDPYWWGYLHGLRVQDRTRSQRLSLEVLANRVAVVYDTPEGNGYQITPWTGESASQSVYGIRERILTLKSTDEVRALAWRDAELARQAYPKWLVGVNEDKNSWAVLECRGWFETLDWRYYSCATVDPIDTTAQLNAIVSACGQFLAGTRVENPSGIFTTPWRDGLTGALGELEALAELGDMQGNALRLRIDNNRVLVVERVPLPGEEDWSLGEDETYRDRYGVRLPRWANPVGRWVRPAGWAYAPGQPLGGGVGAGYVEKWEYRFQ